jgi:hypothetical protein
MGIFALAADERVANVRCAQDTLAVDLSLWHGTRVCCMPRPTRESSGEFLAVVMAFTGLNWMKT